LTRLCGWIGELACGNLRIRQQVIELLQGLPAAQVASDAEALLLIERDQLMGRGIGYVDAHLLASARLSHCRLWSQGWADPGLLRAARHPGPAAACRLPEAQVSTRLLKE